MTILQKTELFRYGEETKVYVDLAYTEDAYESEISMHDHINDGGEGRITYGKFVAHKDDNAYG